MILRQLTFRGIRSFASKVCFNFGDRGLFYLFGNNQAEPELGANGVGKSTIWWALCWTLYGKTPMGLYAGALKSWHSKKPGYWAELELEVDGNEYVLARGWNPNYLTLNGTTVDQDVVDELVRMNLDSFLYSVMIAQGGQTIFDLRPAQKMELFSTMLGLDRWDAYSQRAKSATADLDAEIVRSEKELERLRGKVDALTPQLRLYKEAYDWNRAQEMEKSGHRRAISKAKVVIETSRDHQGKQRDLLDKVEEQLEGLDRRVDKAKEKLRAARNDQTEAERGLARAENKLETLEKQSDDLSRTSGSRCRVCRQTVSENFAEHELKHLAGERKALIQSISALKDQVDKAERAVVFLEKEQDKVRQDARELRDKVDRVKDLIRELQSTIDRCAATIELAKRAIAAIEKTENPLLEKLKRIKRDRWDYLYDLKLVKYSLREAHARRERTQYWIKGFRDVQLYLIEQALEQFEAETNSALHQVGLQGWEVQYDVERETKSGTVLPQFSVFVRGPTNTEIVPWEAWSGGEKQRLRIAGAMGFMNLMARRMGVTCNVEVWDEPTQHLSQEGVACLIDALRDRAKSLGKSVWLVDHHALAHGGFDRTVIVQKDESGSTLVENH